MRYLALVGALLLTAAPAGAVGFQRTLVPDPDDRPLEAAIWYPSDAPVTTGGDVPFRQQLAVDAAVAGDRLPLIVISHGAGGWLDGHVGTALALAESGFVAIAITHTGNNSRDESYPASRWMVDRPRHVSRAIDHMLDGWSERARIDTARIGIFGFSAGGYTGLVTVGGRPSLARAAAHCVRDPAEPVCEFGMTRDFDTPVVRALDAGAWHHDRRVKAAVLAAAFGFSFDAAALADVAVPIQMWAATNDAIVPVASNARIIRQGLPHPPDYREVRGAGHFVFMGPCDGRLEKAPPDIRAMICADPEGLDRAAFFRDFNVAVVDFFRRQLPS